jgi:hypothetical protein
MESERLPIIEFESQIIEIKTETTTAKILVFVMLQVPYPPTGEILKRAYSTRLF